MASCVRSSRIGNGLIDFSVGVMAVMYCRPFEKGVHELDEIDLYYHCTLSDGVLVGFFQGPVSPYDSLFRRTNYDFRCCLRAVL